LNEVVELTGGEFEAAVVGDASVREDVRWIL
jgi:hypothetical protein